MNNDFRDDLAKAKGLGSVRAGAHHWWHQRLTALIMIPLVLWGAFTARCLMKYDLDMVISTLKKPYNIAPLAILVITLFYHSMLGVKVIIEDYISCHTIRTSLIILLQIFCFVTIITFMIALMMFLNS